MSSTFEFHFVFFFFMVNIFSWFIFASEWRSKIISMQQLIIEWSLFSLLNLYFLSVIFIVFQLKMYSFPVPSSSLLIGIIISWRIMVLYLLIHNNLSCSILYAWSTQTKRYLQGCCRLYHLPMLHLMLTSSCCCCYLAVLFSRLYFVCFSMIHKFI